MADKQPATIPCPACKGIGLVTCPDCRGQGRRHTGNAQQLPCLTCHGRGKTACIECGGKKWVESGKKGK